MVLVLPGLGITFFTALKIAIDASAYLVWRPVVPATHILAQVAAEGAHSTDVRSRDCLSRFSEYLKLFPDYGRASDILQLSQGTYLESLGILFNVVQIGDCLDIDYGLGIFRRILSFNIPSRSVPPAISLVLPLP